MRRWPWLFVWALALAVPAHADEHHADADEDDEAAALPDPALPAAAPAPGDAAEAPPPELPDPLAGVHVTQSDDHPADLVVIVSVDGLRPDAIGPADRTFAMLRRGGVVATHDLTLVRSTTVPSHASMLTGVDDARHGLTWNAWRPERGRVRFPTIFRVARLAGLETAMFVGKNKLRHLVDPADGAAQFVLGPRDCEHVVPLADDFLRTTARGLAFLHFPDPDQAGHRHGWMSAPYRDAVERADRCLARVVEDLAARPHGRDRVLLIVTADHGGHLRSHGTGLDEDRHIPWLAWGGAAARPGEITRPLSTMDTAATALAALGLPQTPTMQGRPILEALGTGNSAPLVARADRARGPH